MDNRNSIVPLIEKIIKKHDHLAEPLTEESIDVLYEDAYHAYQNGNFPASIRLFECITFHRPFEPIYWEGLASALFLQREYSLSIKAWAMVCLLAPKNANAHLFAAECYLSLNNIQDGLRALNEAKNRTGDSHLLNRINLLQETWGK